MHYQSESTSIYICSTLSGFKCKEILRAIFFKVIKIIITQSNFKYLVINEG